MLPFFVAPLTRRPTEFWATLPPRSLMEACDGGVGARVTKAVSLCVVAAAILLLPATLGAQQRGDATNIQGRLVGLQQQLAELSARLEQLRAQDQQLQQRLEEMRTSIDARLERLERGGAGPGRPATGGQRR